MQNSNEEYYTRSVTELADIVTVITCQDVFSTTGIKLVNKNTRLNSSFFERLVRHKILPPLEQCLIVEKGVGIRELSDLAGQLLSMDPPLARMSKNIPNLPDIFEVLGEIKLSNSMIFLLTLARERRPALLVHSMTVVLVCLYLGIKLCLPRNQLLDLATSGLFHDLGELRIDSRMIEEDAHPTPTEWGPIHMHPATAQRMILNSSIYSIDIVNAVMRHHEYIDGSGYPFGLMGIEMGKLAKILSIAEMAASKLALEAMDGVPRLEVALKFNLHKFDPELLGYLSVLYEYDRNKAEAERTIVPVELQHLHSQINTIWLAFEFWRRLLGDIQIRPRSPSAYIHQQLESLLQATREVGINIADKTSVTRNIDGDENCLSELNQINLEILRQITEIVLEVQRRWPNFLEDCTEVGKIVKDWIEYMQSLLLVKRK